MNYLPIDHKPEIQASYVRFRELLIEIPEIDKKTTLGQWLFWGGLLGTIIWIVRIFFGRELPPSIGGLLLLSFIVGWVYKTDALKKEHALLTERSEIKNKMEAIGVHFSDMFGQVTVYAGSIADGNAVSPLSDSCYR